MSTPDPSAQLGPETTCPTCGLQIPAGSSQCIVCAYASPRQVTDADLAPHRPKLSVGRVMGITAIVILMLPASAIAFFATCFATAVSLDATIPQNDPFIYLTTGLLVGSVCGIATFVGLVFWIVRLARPRRAQPVQNP